MRSSAAPFAVLVTVLLLAGCFGRAQDGEPTETTSTDASGAAGASGTAATTGAAASGKPSTAPNATALGHMPHMHDYWLQGDRVVLFDEDVEIGVEETVYWTGVNEFVFKRTAVGGSLWRLPDGATIYEGTGVLEVTATYDAPSSNLGMSYISGNGGTDWEGPVALPSGEVTALDVTADMTDMPHMTKSRWQFYFAPAEGGALIDRFHLKVEIVRMRDIMEFPGHPDLWNGADSKILHQAPGKSAQVSYAKRIPNLLLEREFGEHWIVPAELVPMETLTIEAEVTLTKAEASVGSVDEIRFFFFPADSNDPIRVQVFEGSVAEKRVVFRVPVVMENTDSPYAPESQWRFLVEAATKTAGQDIEPTCGGCVDTDIEFELTLVAYKAELEGAKTMGD